MNASPRQGIAAIPPPPKPVLRKPTVCLVLPPSTFSEEWSNRPSHDVVVGLRRLSAFDDQSAVAVASKRVIDVLVLSDEDGTLTDAQAADEIYNNELFAYAVARSLCDPNDTAKAHPLFPLAEDQVPQYFTSHGIRFVWDHLHKMRLEQSPLVSPANDERVAEIARRLLAGALTSLSSAQQVPARKLLAAIADLLPDVPVEEDADEDTSDVSTYIVHGS